MPALDDRWQALALEAVDLMPAGYTILDREGRIVYYNDYAATILDRKPEYLGRHINEVHNPASRAKIDAMLAALASGRREGFTWRLARGEKEFAVRIVPLVREGAYQGVLHAVMLLPGRGGAPRPEEL